MQTNSNLASGTLPIGSIVASILDPHSVPVGWLVCDGSSIPPQYQQLQTLLGSGNTPNLIGRTLIGAGSLAGAQTDQSDGRGPDFESLGAALPIGSTGGECVHTLTEGEMPSHIHPINACNFGLHRRSFAGDNDNDLPFEMNADTPLTGTDGAGNSMPHFNVQPYFAVTYIIYAGG
jgi:hypothetical protein